jgi:chromate transporter
VKTGSVGEVFKAFLLLGLTSFGGPVAHIGYFRTAFVERHRWLSDQAYAELVALCQFLPGPASSQVGIGIGLHRAGWAGGLAAWIGFTLPSALLMGLFAFGMLAFVGSDIGTGGWLSGLKAVAVAVVAQAVWTMARNLCPDRERATLALASAGLALLLSGVAGQLGAIALGALAGLLLPVRSDGSDQMPLNIPIPPRLAVASLLVFAVLLFGLPLLASFTGNQGIGLLAGFYYAGSLVFGGGHVVLPLLQAQVVGPGWVDNDLFLAGYGAAQAVPGPLFTLAAYLGVVAEGPPGGWIGALIALSGIFLPSFLLLFGILPFWQRLRALPLASRALTGINAAVVGVLLAAFYDPVWTHGVVGPREAVLALAAWGLLALWRWPPWLVVITGALAGGVLI